MASEYTAGKEKGSQSSAIWGLFFQSFSVKSSHMELHPISQNVCFEGSLGVGPVRPTFYLIAWNTERGDDLISQNISHKFSLKIHTLLLDSSECPPEIYSEISFIDSSSVQWRHRV